MLNPPSLMDYFMPSLYYSLVAGGVMHLLSLCIGLWLALKFRQIARMPPDCNPLEENLTSRRHKRNKSSVTAASAFVAEDEKRISTPLDRPPSIPFHATRSPRSSFGSADFPARQYQITPGNSPKNSPRNSATAEDFKRMAGAPSSPLSTDKPAPPPHRSPWRGSYSAYSEVPPRDIVSDSPPSYGHQSRPSTGTVAPHHPTTATPAHDTAALPRPAKFTESWYASESLINRTQERNRAINAAERAAEKRAAEQRKMVRGYQSIRDPYDTRDSDSESDYEDSGNAGRNGYRGLMSPGADELDENDGDLGSGHPNPLRSNPSLASFGQVTGKQGRRPNSEMPIIRKSSALAEIDLNDQRVTGNKQAAGDIADEKPGRSYGGLKASLSKRYTWGGAPRNRNSSIQPESDFYSKPYGELKSATPPVMVGSDRQVSSGNDLGLSGAAGGDAANRYFSFGKRNVSGKVAEEGRGIGWAR
jgi:hypothetical protein